MEKPLKVFRAEHDGKYVFGMSLVIASTKAKAKAMVKAKLEEWKKELPSKETSYIDNSTIELVELDITTPGIHVLFDGAY